MSEGAIPAIFSKSSVVSSCKTSMASSTVTIPTSRFSWSTTGRALKSYLVNIWATLSWSSKVLAEMTLDSMMSSMTSSSSARIRVRMEIIPMSFRLVSVT